IHAEQGYGDAIQMVRFVRQARNHFARVVLECRPELKTLFAHNQLADQVIAFGEEIPACDFFIPFGSLPGVLGITLENLPQKTPYLQAAMPRPAAPLSLPRVGLVWAGNPGHLQDHLRSMSLAELAVFRKMSGVEFVSLQHPLPARDQTALAEWTGRLTLYPPFTDFLATATLVATLDLVITVDTAVAHLAAAMGKPVWILIQHSPDWRWLLERTDSPWYPNVRLFRQTIRGDWQVPLQAASAALAEWLATTAASRHP
ncbi:MAG TPA: glycosyltransferase family 9 protein, partial [Verrucomicrobiae bacterium]